MQPEKDFPQHAATNLETLDASPYPTLSLTVSTHTHTTYGTVEMDANGTEDRILDERGFDLTRGDTPEEIAAKIRQALESMQHPETVGATDADTIFVELPRWAVNCLAIDYLTVLAEAMQTPEVA